MPDTKTVAIIGAGMSGLAAAHTLLNSGYRVTLFEKNRDVGGRVATRRSEGFVYDHGAQYVKQVNPEEMALITERYRLPDLIDIQKPIWIFDGQGKIQEGDAQQNAEPKWSYRSGLTALARRMAEGLTIHFETHIATIQQEAPGWHLVDTQAQAQGNFERLLITIPAPQAITILDQSKLDQDLQQVARTELTRVQYNPLISIMLGYRPKPQERPYYALVNTDKAHDISWLAWEHEKTPERVPDGAGLLIAQMAPQYSQDHYEDTPKELIHDIATRVSKLLQEDLTTPFFTDIQRWRYALPSQKTNADKINRITIPQGLAFCGDGFVGGRIQLALEHGNTVAHQLHIGLE